MKLNNVPYSNYKTQLCRFFEKEGTCKYGKNCSFAHSDKELRKPYDQVTGETGGQGMNKNGNNQQNGGGP